MWPTEQGDWDMTVASELGDCGWCQSAGSVYRGRCRICDTVVVEKTRPLMGRRVTDASRDSGSTSTTAPRGKRRPGWVA